MTTRRLSKHGWVRLRVVVELPVVENYGNTERDLTNVVARALATQTSSREIDGPIGKLRVIALSKFQASRMKSNPHHEQFKDIRKTLTELGTRVSRLEVDTAPHKLAGYD